MPQMIPCQHQCPHKLMQADSLRCPSCGNGPKRLAISPSVSCNNHSPSCDRPRPPPARVPSKESFAKFRSALRAANLLCPLPRQRLGVPFNQAHQSHSQHLLISLTGPKSRTGAQKLPASGQAESHSKRFPPDRLFISYNDIS